VISSDNVPPHLLFFSFPPPSAYHPFANLPPPFAHSSPPRHHLEGVWPIPTDSILARCYRAITDPPNEEGRGDATFENLLLEITAPQRAYVFRAPWQIGICAQTHSKRPSSRISDSVKGAQVMLMFIWEITFVRISLFDSYNF